MNACASIKLFAACVYRWIACIYPACDLARSLWMCPSQVVCFSYLSLCDSSCRCNDDPSVHHTREHRHRPLTSVILVLRVHEPSLQSPLAAPQLVSQRALDPTLGNSGRPIIPGDRLRGGEGGRDTCTCRWGGKRLGHLGRGREGFTLSTSDRRNNFHTPSKSEKKKKKKLRN